VLSVCCLPFLYRSCVVRVLSALPLPIVCYLPFLYLSCVVCATPATYTLESVKSQRTQLVAAPTPSSLSDAKLGEWETSADAFAASVRQRIVELS
jgi:hypothetical protein